MIICKNLSFIIDKKNNIFENMGFCEYNNFK